MAASGLKPVCAIYSTFLQRGYDQVVHDVALQGLPVRFAIDRAGLVGADGATHAGAFDLTYLCSLPGFVVMAPSDEAELRHMIATSLSHDEGPSAVRFPRGAGVGAELPERGEILPIGKGRIIREGEEVAILSLGAHLSECLAAANLLADEGHSPTIADARFAKPIDTELLTELAASHSAIVTVEQGAQGGFGAHVLSHLANTGALDRGLRMRTVTLPDRFIEQAAPNEMYEDAGMTAEDIADVVRALHAHEAKVISLSAAR